MSEIVYNIFPDENFIDLTLYQFGYEKCDSLHMYGPATRNHFLFHYIISGKGELQSTDHDRTTTTYTLEAGQGFLIWPKQHNTYIADEKDPWSYAWIEFDGLKAKGLILQTGITFGYPIYASRNAEETTKMKDEMLKIAYNKNNSPIELIGHLYLFMAAFIASSTLNKKTISGKLKDFYIKEALVFIEQNYQNEISIEDLATFCNLNRSYLGKIFKKTLALTPQEFLIQYRLNKASELLKITDYAIGEVSTNVGYVNQLHFSRAFKRLFGKSPTVWRADNKLK